MKFRAIQAIFHIGAMCSPVQDTQELIYPEDFRLIELVSGQRLQLGFEELLDLKRNGVDFMDITYHSHRSPAPQTTYQYPEKMSQTNTTYKLIETLSKDNLIDSLSEFSSFYSRFFLSYSGKESSTWLYNKVRAAAGSREDIEVSFFEHRWPQSSVIARFMGAKTPENVVIVGAHQDSINLLMPFLLPAPGADDDGSGSMTILEVFRVLATSDWRPSNTVEFHWYSAEEGGLLGSQDIAGNYSDSEIRVTAMLEQDMTGYSAGSLSHGQDAVAIMKRDDADENLTDYIRKVVEEYCTIGWVYSTLPKSASSDYASWKKIAGCPSSYVFESAFEDSNPYIHSLEDTVDKLDFDHMLEHARFTLGFAIELGHALF